jgi:leucyl aminopeptidase
MQNTLITQSQNPTIPIITITAQDLAAWLAEQAADTQAWVQASGFNADPDTWCLLPGKQGQVSKVLAGVVDPNDFWSLANLAANLPAGEYTLENITDKSLIEKHAVAWGLSQYQFSRYKAPKQKEYAKFVLPKGYNQEPIFNTAAALNLVRDLINLPSQDMGPAELAQVAEELAQSFGASFKQLVGEKLLKHNFPLVYTVGQASTRAPRLIDIRWGKPKHPKLTLVGKGVCFDTGGLDLKPAAGMLLMKKDMAGAAHVLGLARMIMAAKLPVQLRVLIPAVENAVSGNAYRPGDILRSRHGLSIEIGNTDAEGRLILADAISAACEEQPQLLLDFATLTGAARIAMGTDISAMFTPDTAIAAGILEQAIREKDPVWHMPLYSPYRKLLDSRFADLNNVSTSPYGGAILAALFLQEFVDKKVPWVHFDIMAWNVSSRPGRPEGGEAMALRAVFRWLTEQWLPSLSI